MAALTLWKRYIGTSTKIPNRIQSAEMKFLKSIRGCLIVDKINNKISALVHRWTFLTSDVLIQFRPCFDYSLHRFLLLISVLTVINIRKELKIGSIIKKFVERKQ